jgi:acyl transferase domain-containing protein/acyl carrier protein
MTGLEIAVIGMAGRFPGAPDVDAFWENLKQAREFISFFSQQEMEETGVDAQLLEDANYVKAGGLLEGIEYFDCTFFGYTPMEADVMDPQMRVFHQCVWQALEHAGYCPETYDGLIGLYAGAAAHSPWEFHVQLSGKAEAIGAFSAFQLMNRDFLCTQLSYRLNLKGPAVAVQTACSTSLSAIHLAGQAILNGECDLALAGGVSVITLQKTGYVYQQGMIPSADGHCRTFDSKARGTIGGDGAGVVVLKRLENAVPDGDYIYAVMKGSAINNDGVRKVGFTAPSIEGQAEVIIAAQEMAEVEPESITYVEAHGTGTELGDPVEIEALKLAFATAKRGYCAIGSAKTNVGHLNTAAGVTGFIKAVLALHHRLIPPSLHFESPNPKIDFEHSPFYVNTALHAWQSASYPLRAGVSSFGIGGTNAHVILEEYVPEEDRHESCLPCPRPYHLIPLSARSQAALEQVTGNLIAYFKTHGRIDLADVAYTLQKGRKAFKYRKTCVCATVDEAADILADPGSGKIYTAIKRDEQKEPPVIFMFPGQGAQYVNMARDLYEGEKGFQQEMDRCLEILKPLLGIDVREILYPGQCGQPEDPAVVDRTEIAQPLIFAVEYALARFLMSWGIRPYALIGHSIGEYVAACLAGVFGLEDALEIVTVRGQLMQELPEGAMLSVPLPAEALTELLKENDELSLAAVNATSLCVVSGPTEAVAAFARQLKEQGCQGRTLHTSHAFHSKMMAPMTAAFEKRLAEIDLKPQAGIPYISNVTGTWADITEAAAPPYWARHVGSTVRFADGLTELLDQDGIFVEVGPGRSLSTFVRQHERRRPDQKVIDLIRHPKEEAADTYYLLTKVGQLWGCGINIDWAGFYGQERRRRIPLPLYPFEGRRFRLDGVGHTVPAKKGKRSHIGDWFYVPCWKPSPITDNMAGNREMVPDGRYLVFVREESLERVLLEPLRQHNGQVIGVRPGSKFARLDGATFVINPGKEEDYLTLLAEIHWNPQNPHRIIHGWNVSRHEERDVDSALDLGFYSLLYLARAVGRGHHEGVRIMVVSNRMQAVDGQDSVEPLKAVSRGAVRVISREYPGLTCRSIDFDELSLKPLLKEIEMSGEGADMFTAYRGEGRWVETFEPALLKERGPEAAVLKERGVYLITGGLGGIGLVLAQYLATTCKARLILTGRSAFPGRERWDEWLLSHGKEDETARKIGKIRDMEAAGAEVWLVRADAADEAAMRQAAARAEERFGPVNGIIHSAGTADAGLIHHRTGELSQTVLAPKVKGTLVLDAIFGSRGNGNELDFFLLCSSLSSVLAPVGQVAYCAANAFLDAFAHKKAAHHSTTTVSVNWDTWQEVGMAVRAVKQLSLKRAETGDEFKDAIQPEEGVEVFTRLLGLGQWPQVLISTTDLLVRIDRSLAPLSRLDLDEFFREDSIPESPRPELSVPYVAAGTDTERMLVRLWQAFLGIKPVGIHDDFFELGGDSLKVMTISAKIHKELQVEIPLTEFFNRATIKKMAAYIDGAGTHAYAPIQAVETREYYPLSPAQKRLYLLQQMEPESVAYNIFNVVVLKGEISRAKLAGVFRELIRRHESCRTSFITLAGEVFQRVQREVDFEILTHPVPLAAGHPSQEGDIEGFMRPFVLAEAPLLRVGLVELAEGEQAFMLDTHHIVSDGTSMAIIIREFMALYGDRELPGLRVQYKDYARWQSRERERPSFKAQEEYWLREFAAGVPLLNLPTDFPRPAVQSLEGHSKVFDLGAEESVALKRIASEQEASLFVVVLSLLNILLARITHQYDIVIGTQVAGRRHADLEDIVGVFLNTLVLHNYPRKEKTYKDFLNEVKARTWQAFENQEYPFEDLVQKVLGSRTLDRNPFFDVMLVWQNMEMKKIEIPGLTLKPYEGELKPTALIDLSFYGYDNGEHLTFILEYNSRLFKRETIDRLIAYFKEIGSEVTANREISLADIKISHDLDTASAEVFGDEDSAFGF